MAPCRQQHTSGRPGAALKFNGCMLARVAAQHRPLSRTMHNRKRAVAPPTPTEVAAQAKKIAAYQRLATLAFKHVRAHWRGCWPVTSFVPPPALIVQRGAPHAPIRPTFTYSGLSVTGRAQHSTSMDSSCRLIPTSTACGTIVASVCLTACIHGAMQAAATLTLQSMQVLLLSSCA